MGKGNRNRQERLEEKVLNPQKYVKKKQMPAFVGPLLMALIAVLLVVVLVGNLVVSSGLVLRARTAAESEDFEVDGTMMSYFMHSSYTSYINYYYELYSSIASSSSNFNVENYLPFDTNVSLKKQIYDKESGQTWFEYFADLATKQAEELLVYAQAAKTAGVTLEDEDIAVIDQSIATMKSYADMYGMSVNDYLANNYGKGVRLKDVRRVLELSQLASKYAASINEDLYDASTEEKVNAFYAENENDYLTADYLSYVLTVTKDKTAEDADAQYAADKATLDEAANKLAGMKTEQEFKDYIKSYFATASLDEYMDKHYADYLAKAEGSTDEEKAAAAEQAVKDKVAEDAEAEVEDILTEGMAYTVDTEVGKWVFGTEDTDAAAVNTTHKIVDASKDEDGTYSVTVYFLTRAASRNENTTRTFTYLLLEEKNYTEEDAKKALADLESGEKTAEALLELSKKYEKLSGAQTLEDASESDVGVDEIEAWLFTDDRKAGDCTQITYTYEDVEFYIVVLVDEIGPAEWYVNCRDAQVASEMSDWFDEASKTHVVTVNDKVINKINM